MLQEISSFIFQIHQQQPTLWYLIIAILGALAGSFITMLCHRLPIMLEWQPSPHSLTNSRHAIPHERPINLFLPRSFCPNCQRTLKWWQNIPILSYALLKGRCHFCQHSIASSYFFIEATCVALSLTTALILNHPIHSFWWLIFTWLALALIILDSKYLLLPDSLNYALLWSGLLFSVTNQNAQTAIISACIGYASFALINTIYRWIRKRDGIGQGDFKLTAGIAVWFGWQELPAVVLLGSILGLCYALFLFLKNKTIDMGLTLPFAPFLLTGAWLWLMYQSSA